MASELERFGFLIHNPEMFNHYHAVWQHLPPGSVEIAVTGKTQKDVDAVVAGCQRHQLPWRDAREITDADFWRHDGRGVGGVIESQQMPHFVHRDGPDGCRVEHVAWRPADADLVELVMKDKLPWRLNRQEHNYIWPANERRR